MSDFALSWAALGRLDEDADGEEPEAEEDADGEEAESEVDEDAGGADDPDDEDEDADGDEDEDADGDEDEEDDDAEGEEDAEGVEDEVPDGGEDLLDEEADGLGSPGPEPTRSLPDSVQAAAAIVTSARAPNPVSNTFMTICSFSGRRTLRSIPGQGRAMPMPAGRP